MKPRADRAIGSLLVESLGDSHYRIVRRSLPDCAQVQPSIVVVADPILQDT